MSVFIEISTDKRVKEILPILLQTSQISMISEIDSMNYGEGFDLKYKTLDIRVYDDIRSDEVFIETDFLEGRMTWDEAFEKIVKQNTGKGLLTIEIDRYNRASQEIQSEAAKIIEETLSKEKLPITIKLI